MQHVERRKEILKLILDNRSVKVGTLSEKYKVGEATIRRDLKYLAKEYGITLSYGGAFTKEKITYQTTPEMDIFKKRTHNIEEKRMIAEKAANLIEDGDTIALNAGSTVELMLDYLENIKNVNLITLSLNTALRASLIQGITVYMPGGRLRSFSGAFYGKEATEFLRTFNIDKAFMGAMAVSMSKGITHGAFEEVEINQTIYEISRKCYLLADYSKFDKISLTKMVDLSIFNGFILDDKTPETYREYCKSNGIEII
ncbi:DeoR/GlpR family DNA-binding transcription regulator [Acetobacterium bakii]|uniref:DeoR faimly transcriptional regulator n=1 Tax=Acetobacterium bakii TaxID=52689 RepID=A0A0L6TW03_9FIRM|nr:DeoR/GlpR family DNA-binding transcription regulator [Acetobacterium bakii]KNZ40428.1 DeoR faimly transcriptional regulator [Acetobacterium bakii]